MRPVAQYSLWLGNAGDLAEPATVMSLGIEAVVELADSERPAVLPRELIRLRFPLSDGGENAPWLLRFAVESTAILLRTGVPTAVCCGAGMSRSICIAAGAVALLQNISLLEAMAVVVADGPADVSPGFFEQMLRALGD